MEIVLEIDCTGMPESMKYDLDRVYPHQDVEEILERLEKEISAYRLILKIFAEYKTEEFYLL